MTKRRILAAATAAFATFALSGGIQASEKAIETGTVQPERPEASIPFVGYGSIRSWRADGREGIYVQATGGNWYHATLLGNCSDLPFTETVGFDTGGVDRLDRFSSVIVGSQRCPFTSLVASAPPPSRKDAERRKQTDRPNQG